MHEILTVQLGTAANYVGTHYWNTQESYFTYSAEDASPVDHNVHFRAGRAPNGAETFTPRTLIYDLKDNFGALRKREGEYEESYNEVSSLWNNTTAPLRTAPQIPIHPYIASLSNADNIPSQAPLIQNPVRSFTDFSHTYYHPRSLLPISLSSLPTPSSLHPLQSFAAGEELFEHLDRGLGDSSGEGDLFERDLRRWAEECDGLQGVQVFTGTGDAWGGFAGRWCERWRDEMGGKSCWVWGVEGAKTAEDETREKRLQRLLNSTRALYNITTHASIYVPLNIPTSGPAYLNANLKSPWQVSALQATALETMTLPSRLHRTEGVPFGSLSNVEETTTGGANRRIAKLEFSVADQESLAEQDTPMTNGHSDQRRDGFVNGYTHEDDAEEKAEILDIDLFSGNVQLATGGESGASAQRTSRREHVFGRVEVARGKWNLASTHPEPEDRLRAGSVLERFSPPLPFPQFTSFPSIYSIANGRNLAVRTALSTSTSVAARIRDIESIVRRYVDVEERENMCHGLKSLCEEYEEGWESGSDEGTDEE